MSLPHLHHLEEEAIYVLREVMSKAENPAMLFSIGKDSAVLLHLARKAFYPSDPPFPLLHIDTTWKFKEMYAMREKMAARYKFKLLIYQNKEALRKKINPFDHGELHTQLWKTEGLKQALDKYRFDFSFAGARRDEEKSRAKERVVSLRNKYHNWDPRGQRPELWSLFNLEKAPFESFRVFPLSNWTELDIWEYISIENIDVVSLYFAKKRLTVERDDTLIMVDDERFPLKDKEVAKLRTVRFRTLGCYPLTGAVESQAKNVRDIIAELSAGQDSERKGRIIDSEGGSSMEAKKQQGYF